MRATLISWLDGLYAWLEPARDEVRGEPQYQYWLDDDDRLWHYTLVAGNNEPMSESTQGYAGRAAVRRAIEADRRNASIAQVIGVQKQPRE